MSYSRPVKKAILEPRNGPKQYPYNGIGENLVDDYCRTSNVKTLKNKIVFKVFIENEFVLESRWEVFGDPVAIAACMWCRDKLNGTPLSNLHHIMILEQLILDLEIDNRNDINNGCLAAIKTVAAAIDNYKNKLI